jgi:hypothetical protein
MWGGEIRTGKEVLEVGTVVYHGSNAKLKYFEDKGVPESTCFFRDMRGTSTDHMYRVTITKARTVGCYGYEEVRFNPSSDNCIVEYVGVNYSKLDAPVRLNIID